jgi:hypothetical protein
MIYCNERSAAAFAATKHGFCIHRIRFISSLTGSPECRYRDNMAIGAARI